MTLEDAIACALVVAWLWLLPPGRQAQTRKVR